MKSLLISTVLLGFLMATTSAEASKYQDMVNKDTEAFQNYFKKKFPKTEYADFQNGVYSIDAGSRAQWEAIEEFPPYELNIDSGEKLFNTPFKNGKSYADCFENGGIGIAHKYPMYDSKAKEVLTIELLLNRCREANGEKPLGYKKGKIADISAYMHYTARDQKIDIKVDSKGAYDAYMDGKKFFYAKRGQLNFSCADCHMRYAGGKLRADITSPALGHITGFPVYRSKWSGLGTIQRRYDGCNKNVRAKPFKTQGTEYRNLQYFQTVMSNGLITNGPSARK